MSANAQGQNTGSFNLAALQQQPPYKSLLRAEQITHANFPFLSEQEITQYPAGVKNLWAAIASKPADDATHQTALKKLTQLTSTVLKKYHSYQALVNARRAETAAQQDGQRPPSQGNQGQQPQPQPPQQQQQQQAQQPQQQQQTPQYPQQPQNKEQIQAQQQSQAQLPSQNQVPSHTQGTSQQQQGAPQPTPSTNVQAQQQQQDPAAAIRQKVEGMHFEPPPNLSGPEADGWRAEAPRRYEKAMFEQMKARSEIIKLEKMAQQARVQGQDIPNAILEARVKAEQRFKECNKMMESLLQYSKGNSTASQVRNPNNGLSAQTQPMQRTGSGGAQGRMPQQGQIMQPSVAPTVEAVRQQQVRPASPSLPTLPQQNQMPASQMSQTLSLPASQPSAFPGQRPQPNPTQAVQFAPTQTQSPQSTMPLNNNQQGSPAPLSQQAAIALAQRSYSSQPQGLPQVGMGAGSNSRADMDKNNNKQWPMDRKWVPQTPQPVQMGPARPTLSGMNNGPMGMMGQPSIQKQPPFLLHGAGDRVLDKKKLDELVRQVTGGTGESLHPEVEESVLQLADEFIDNVITSACKLAKLRGSSTLEIRDIQLVLERQYNIRVPGYATDEIRTVRKVQPAAGYLQKMNAVQAAKVMGGKTDI